MTGYVARQWTVLVCVVIGLGGGCIAEPHWLGLVVMLITGVNFGALVYGRLLKQMQDNYDNLRLAYDSIQEQFLRVCTANRMIMEPPANDDK